MNKSEKKYLLIGSITLLTLVMVTVGYFFIKSMMIDPTDPKDIDNDIPQNIHSSKNIKDSQEYKTETEDLKIKVKLGNDQISTENGESYMLVELQGASEIVADKEETKKRVPINLSVVIDRSGSMNGEKINNVKEALKSVTKMLTEEDRISIVTYSNDVSTIYESQYFDEEKFLEAVDKVYTGGSTNLEGGLKEGLINVQGLTDNTSYINKVILLSDGLANVGVSDPKQLAKIVKEEGGGEILVSTIGVGADYDDKLMSEVAIAGNGNYYFLENPTDAERIFAQEFENTMNIIAKDMQVKFNMHDDFEVLRGIGYELDQKEGFEPNDIYVDKTSVFMFKIKSVKNSDLKSLKDEDIVLSNLTISGYSTTAEEEFNLEIPVRAKVVDGNVHVLADNYVYKRFMENVIAEEMWKMYEQLDEQENIEAQETVDELLKDLDYANSRLDGEFDEEVDEVKEKQGFVAGLEEEENVNDSSVGRIFQKSNQSKSYDAVYNK